LSLTTFTMEILVYLTSLSGYNPYIMTLGNLTGQYGLGISINQSGQVVIAFNSCYTTASPCTTNTWLHIVITYSGTTFAVYVNGTAYAVTGAVTASNVPASITQLALGSFYVSGGLQSGPTGRIAMARLYNVALTAAQVTQNYNSLNAAYNLGIASVVYPPVSIGATVASVSTLVATYFSPSYTTVINQTYGNGVYTATASSYNSTNSNYPYYAFDKTQTNIWATATASYSTVTGGYIGGTTAVYQIVINGATFYGEWLSIALPNRMILTSYTLQARNDASATTYYAQSPSQWILAGSNDGVGWTALSLQSSAFTSAGQSQTFTVTTSVAYSSYIIVILATGINNGFASIGELILNGGTTATTTPYSTPTGQFQWLDAQNTASLTTTTSGTSTNVTTWGDSSVNGNSVTTSTGTPVYVPTGSMNAYPCIYLSSARMASSAVQNSANITIALVTNTLATPVANGTFWGHLTSGTRDTDISVRADNTVSNAKINLHTSTNNGNCEIAWTATPTLWIGTMAGGSNLYWEATPLSTGVTTVVTQTVTSTIALGTKAIYVGSDDTTDYCNSFIGEIQYFQSAFTPAQVTNLRNYLLAKWGAPATTTDPYYGDVALLLHFDGNFTDSSSYNQTVTASGTVSTSSSTFKMGTGAFYSTGTAGTNNVAITSPALTFGTNNFTFEFWINPASGSNNVQARIFGNCSFNAAVYSTNNWVIGWQSGTNNLLSLFAYNIVAGTTATVASATTLSVGTWYHVAIVRNGTTFYFFLNGILQNTYTSSKSMDAGSISPQSMYIGTSGSSTSVSTEFFNGYLDDIRITMGVARYTSNFTIPVAAFPNSGGLGTPSTALTTITTSVGGLYTMSFPFTFTSMGGTGGAEPLTITYGTTTPGYGTAYALSLAGGIQYWTVPVTGTYQIIAAGGAGGAIASYTGGKGVIVANTFYLTAGTILKIIPGEAGVPLGTVAGGGGGGSYVATTGNVILLVAGGGGGASGSIAGTNAILAPYNSTTTGTAGVAAQSVISGMTSGFGAVAAAVGSAGGGGGGYSSGTPSTSTSVTAYGGGSYDANGPYGNAATLYTGLTGFGTGYNPAGGFITVNYLSSTGTASAATVSATAADPYFANVNLLLHCDGNFNDSSPINAVLAPASTSAIPTISTTIYKFGSASLAYNATANNWLTTPSSSAYALQSYNFTLEFWIYLTASATSAGIMGNTMNSVFYPATNSTYDPYFNNVALLLQGDGNFTDSSLNNTTLAVTGAVTTTASSKFGTGALSFPGSAFLTTPVSSAYTFGTSNFTIESWIYLTGGTSANQIRFIGNCTLGSTLNDWLFGIQQNGNVIVSGFANSAGGPSALFSTGTIGLSLNTWYHWAFVRNGNTYTQYINGAQDVTGTFNFNVDNSTARPINIGGDGYVAGATETFIGYLDSVRVTIGVARYTAPFQVPTAAFPNNINWAITQTTGGVINFLSASATTPSMSATVTTGAWHHIAVVRNGSTFYMFADGAQAGTFTSTTAVSSLTSDAITIGGYNVTGVTSFNGFLDEIRLTVGVARYIAPFTATVPTAAFPNQLSYQQNSGAAPAIPSTDPYFSYVVLLLHGQQIGGSSTAYTLTSTNIVDSSLYAVNSGWTIYGSPNYVTQGKVSSSSYALANASGSYFRTPTASQYVIGLNNFTLEFWFYATSFPASPAGNVYGLIGNGGAAYNGTGFWRISINASLGNKLFCDNAFTGTTGVTSLVAGQWYHVAVVRNGLNVSIYLNGVVEASATQSSTFYLGIGGTAAAPITSDGINIGNSYAPGTAGTQTLDGYMQEIRITNGIARYTANFTPPSAPFSNVVNSPDPYYANEVLLLHADGNFNDSSIYNTPMTLSGSPTITTTAKFGTGAFSFNGTSSLISTPLSSIYAFGINNFTIEFWFYRTGTTTTQRIMGNLTAAWGSNNFVIGSDNSGANIVFYINNYNVSTPLLTGTTAISANTWYHYALVRNGTTFTQYINGAVDKQATSISTNIDNSGFQTISIGSDGYSAYFAGYIDEVRITTGVARYTAAFTPAGPFSSAIIPISPAITPANFDPYFNYVTLLLHGSNFTDSSSYNVSMTNTTSSTGVTTSSSIIKFGSASLSYNGTSILTTPSSSAFTFGTNNFTIEFWFYPTTVTPSSGMQILGNFTSGVINTNEWLLNIISPGKIQFLGWYTGNATWTGTNTLIVNTWNHYALVRSGTVFTGYLNGQVDGTYTNSISFDSGTANTLSVGGSGYSVASGNNNCLYGYMQEIRVTNGIARYTSSFPVPAAPFSNYGSITTGTTVDPYFGNVALLLHGDSSAITDSSLNNATLTASGTVSPSFTIYKFGSASLNFNGAAFLSTPSSSVYAFGSNNFTIEFWFYSNDYASQHQFIGNYPPNSAANFASQWYIQNNAATNKLLFYTYNVMGATNGGTAWTGVNTYLNSVWNHYALVRSGNVYSGYLNGVLDGSYTSANNLDTGGSQYFNVGGSGFSYTNAAANFNGYIDEVRVTIGVARYTGNFAVPTAPFPNAAITAAPIAPPAATVSTTAGYMLDGLSSAAISTVAGLYSCVRLLTSYTGPVLNLRRSTDNVTSDFYADLNGVLWTGAGGTGTIFNTWIGTGTAYVATWYDQSGKAKHATQSTAASQPSLNATTRAVSFNSTYLQIPDGALPSGNSPYTYSIKALSVALVSSYSIFLTGGSYASTQNIELFQNATAVVHSWYGSDLSISTTTTTNQTYSFTYDQSNRYTYVNSILQNTTASSSHAQATTGNYIGYDSRGYYCGSSLSSVSVFSSVLSSTDRLLLEYQYLSPTSIVYALDGISTAGLATANGLYSCKRLLTAYTGPVMNLRLSTSSTNPGTDFYADLYGNLWTGPGGTGTTFATWVGANTAYVYIWYDQSGKCNHATQSTNANQPVYNATSKLVDFSIQSHSYLTMQPNTVPLTNSYTMTTKHGTFSTSAGMFGGGSQNTSFANWVGVYANVYYNPWFNNDYATATSAAAGNVISFVFNCTTTTAGAQGGTTTFYVNGSSPGSLARSNWGGVASTYSYIGQSPHISLNEYFVGQLYYVSLFTSALSNSDRAILEAQ
jgi:hypothetical protein